MVYEPSEITVESLQTYKTSLEEKRRKIFVKTVDKVGQELECIDQLANWEALAEVDRLLYNSFKKVIGEVRELQIKDNLRKRRLERIEGRINHILEDEEDEEPQVQEDFERDQGQIDEDFDK